MITKGLAGDALVLKQKYKLEKVKMAILECLSTG